MENYCYTYLLENLFLFLSFLEINESYSLITFLFYTVTRKQML